MRTINIQAVIICDATGGYIIHGASGSDPIEMFRALSQGPWTFDPSKETVHYIKIPVNIPEYEDSVAAEDKTFSHLDHECIPGN